MRSIVFFGIVLVCLASCASESDPSETLSGSADQTVDSVDNSDESEAKPADDDGDDDHGDDEGHDDDDHDDDGDDHDGDDDHDDDEARGFGAHEHGSAELAVASSGNDLIIDLISPTNNIFGFENEATTGEDKAIVKDRTEALSSPSILVINSEAGCELSGDVATEVVSEGSHAEITASWEFVCENPDQLETIDIAGLFSEFPKLEDVDAEVASASGQTSAELSPSSTGLALK